MRVRTITYIIMKRKTRFNSHNTLNPRNRLLFQLEDYAYLLCEETVSHYLYKKKSLIRLLIYLLMLGYILRKSSDNFIVKKRQFAL